MTAPLEWHPAAIRDLEYILDRIAADSPSAAQRWGSALLRKVELLAASPELGPVSRHASSARQLVFGDYIIYYTHRGRRVVIRAVVHGAQLFRSSWLRRRR